MGNYQGYLKKLAKTLQTLLHALPHYQINGYGMLKLPVFTPEKTI